MVLTLSLSACPAPRSPRGPSQAPDFTGCLPLTGTSRSALRLGPDGRYLYWVEQVRLHGYEDAWPETAVVRWPVAGGAVERLTTLLDNPYRVLADGRLVGARKDAGVAVWGPSGAELVSFSGTIEELELMPGDDVVVYRMGGSIWRQPIHREGARWLAYASSLLGVDGDTAIIRTDEGLVRVDVSSGKQTSLIGEDDVIKAYGGGLVIERPDGIAVRPLAGGALSTVLAGSDWQVRLAPDGVRAWHKVGPRLEGAIVLGGPGRGAAPSDADASARVDRLPPVLGGDSLEGFVRLPDGRVAYLIGHDLDGDDTVTTGDEVDVCLAADKVALVRVTPRAIPERWRAAAPAITALVDSLLGGGAWHFGAGDGLPGIYVEAKANGRDRERPTIWADTRAVAAAVGEATGDPTLFVDIEYADERRGYSEWWSVAGRRVAWAGVGGATVPDLADYDALIDIDKLELIVGATGDADEEADEDEDEDEAPAGRRALCAGKVVNRSQRRLVDVVADCVSGVDDEVVEVFPPNLAPGETGRFEGVVTVGDDDSLAVSIHSGEGRDEVPAFSTKRHALYEALAAAAFRVLDRTYLVYRSARSADGETVVYLSAPDDFARGADRNRERAASTAFAILDPLDREAFGGKQGDRLVLQLTDDEDASWSYRDGELSGP